jgi:radical SAM protein with 4Fe4S-binding SPASM domain
VEVFVKELSKFKILAHMDRLKELVDTGDTKPITIEIDPINVCNHKCVWCADHKAIHGGEILSLEFVRKVLKELKECGAKSVLFKGGGEPTLHPQLVNFVNTARDCGMKAAMLTNGSKLKNNESLQDCILKNMEYVRISLDAPDEMLHRYWHRTKDWKTILKGISQLSERKRDNGSSCLIGVNILYDPKTYKELPKGVRLAESLGVDVLSFRKAYTTPYGFGNPWTAEALKEEREIRDHIRSMKHSLRHLMVDASRGEEIEDTSEDDLPYCLAVPLISVICADGCVYPCCDLRMVPEYRLGDLHKNTFLEIWHSEKRRQVMEKVRDKRCYGMCTHRFAYYNKMLNYLVDPDKPHVEIV